MPPAIRATNLAARDLLTVFHPLAVGAERPTNPVFRDYVRRGVLNLKFPLAALRTTFRAVLRPTPANGPLRCSQRSCEQQSGTGASMWEQLTKPSAPEGRDSRSYCPRCRA
jgi:hypothetical protein